MHRPQFEAAVERARPGATIVYHTGHMFGGDRKIGPDHQAVDNTARAAWIAMEAGKVHLVQKRIKDGVYMYMALKRPKPHKRVEWTGCYNPAYIYKLLQKMKVVL